MFRFFIDQKIEDPQNIIINDRDIIHKLGKVLRKKKGDTFVLFDQEANEYLVRIKELNPKEVICEFINKSFVDRELPVDITLYQSILKKDKFEWVLQKATEIGVRKIVPISTEFTIAKEYNSNKIKRYQKIIEEATIQSGGKIIPVLSPMTEFKDALLSLNPQDLNLICYEQEEENDLPVILNLGKNKKINLFIGPEGGFSNFEIDLARQNSLQLVGLGKRILRSETAAIVACGAIAINSH